MAAIRGLSKFFCTRCPPECILAGRNALNAFLRGETPSICAHEWLGALAGYTPKKLSAIWINEFRPIASICSKYMIFLKIITVRLNHATEDYGLLDDAQEGLQHCRGTKRQLAKLHCLLADQRRRKKCISVLLYMDIINAFNSSNHRAIFSIMAANGFPEECILAHSWSCPIRLE
jgi:hypothetical protein